MPLSADLSTRLDLSGLLDGLLDGLAQPTTDLHDATPPVENDELSGSAELTVTVEVSGVGSAVGSVSAQVPALLGRLPDPAGVIGPLSGAITLVEQVTTGDLAGQVRTLLAALRTALDEAPEGDFLAALERLRALLAERPEARAVLDLLVRGAAAGGLDLRPMAETVAGMVPAGIATVRALGALLGLESTLAEGERLTAIMATQLDADEVARTLAALRAAFAIAAGRLQALADAEPDEVEGLEAQAVAEVTAAAARLAATEGLLARGMGFGEATLVHFDVARIEADVRAGAELLRVVDTDAVGRAVRAVVDNLAPTLRLDVDVAAAPAQGLDALLSLLESKSAEIGAAITALDLSPIADPITRGIETATAPLAALTEVVERVTAAVRGALEQVRQVIASLPIGEIADAIHTLLGPVVQALDFVRNLVARVEEALGRVAEEVTGALAKAEQAIDTFRAEADRLLGEAADFIEGLNLDQVVGQVAERVNAFAAALAAAEMRPYFDTTVDVIDTTADVIGALPLGLLPDSMKSELDAAVAPVRAIDVEGVKDTVEGWLQIQDGRFAVRPLLEESVAEVQDAYEQLVAVVRDADPRNLIAPINAQFDLIRGRVAELSPALALEPLQEAVDRVKGALAEIDLEAVLQPVDEAFAAVLAAMEPYSPEALLGGVVERVNDAREAIVGEIRLDEWGPSLDWAADQAKALAARLDPTLLEPYLARGMADADAFLATAGGGVLALPFGDLVASLASSAGMRTDPQAFHVVWRWLGGGDGNAALSLRGERIQAAITATRDAVAGVDLGALAAELGGRASALRAAAAALPDGPARDALEPVLAQVRPDVSLAFLDANRARYLAALDGAVAKSASLRATGLSQVEVTVSGLRAAFSPAALLREFVHAVLERLGITGFEEGVQGIVRRVLAVATPQRLAGILVPIALAIRGKVAELVDALLAPLQEGVSRLTELVDAVDLQPFLDSLTAIYDEARAQVQALNPRTLLAPELASFTALQQELQDFDPLQPVRQVLDALRETALRVLDKLDAAALLAQPIRIYDEIMAALRSLDLQALLAPVLDTLDALAAQVDDGLDRTTDALERLQAALPAPGSGGGGASVSVSASLAA